MFLWNNLENKLWGLVKVVFRLQNKDFQFLSSPNGTKSANFGHFESLNSDFDPLVSIFYILVFFLQHNLEVKFMETS